MIFNNARYKTVSRTEFMRSVEVKDIKSVINAEHELCKICDRGSICNRFNCDMIEYAVKEVNRE